MIEIMKKLLPYRVYRDGPLLTLECAFKSREAAEDFIDYQATISNARYILVKVINGVPDIIEYINVNNNWKEVLKMKKNKITIIAAAALAVLITAIAIAGCNKNKSDTALLVFIC